MAMQRSRVSLVSAFVGLALLSHVHAQSVEPKGGFVPDDQTAIRIALAVWEPIYGKEAIARQKPYRATLSNGVWTVVGSLPKNILGGVAVAEISQVDARVLRVSHGK
jgi:NTF2 fold immunity protein